MADGIEFLIDIEAKLDGAIAATGALRKFIETGDKADKTAGHTAHSMNSLADASDKAGSAHGRHAHGLINLGHQFEYAKNGVNEFLEAIGLILVFEGFEKIFEKVKELGEEILHAAGKAERAELSFKLLLGDTEGGELLEYIEQITKHTEFTGEELKGMTQGLLKAGFAAKEIPRALAAGLDIASFSANATEGFSTALNALERIKRTGRVDNRVLAGLGFGEKDFLAAMSKSTGKSTEILKKELEKGKVDTVASVETLYSLIHERTGKALGGAGVDMSKTLEARLKHLKDIPEEMFQSLSKTDAFFKLSDAIGSVAEDLGPEGQIGQMLARNLEAAFSASVDYITGLDWSSMFVTAIDLGKGFLDLVKDIAGVFETIVQYGNQLNDFLESVLTLGHLTDKLGITHMGDRTSRQYAELDQDPMVKRANEEAAAKRAQRLRLQATPGALEAIHGLRVMDSGLSGLAPGLPAGLLTGMSKSIMQAGSAGQMVGDAAVEGAKKALDAHSPSRKFMQLGQWSAEGYEQGLAKNPPSMAAQGYMEDALTVTPPSIGAGSLLSEMKTGGMAPKNITVSTSVNVSVAGSNASPEAIAEAIRLEVPSAILSALEQMALEGGQE